MTHDALPPAAANELAKRLKWPLRLTAAGMLGERVWKAFFPFVSIVLALLAALMAGLPALLVPGLLRGLALLAALAAITAVLGGIRRFHAPHRSEVLTRLDATLPGQPIAALADVQAIGAGDAGSEAVWRAHQMRMVARVNAARAVAPDLRVAVRDPFALRLMALLGFVMALGFGNLSKVTELGDLVPGPQAEAAIVASWEGWIEPPAYTGKPSLYLNDQKPGPLAVPSGSRLTLRLYGKLGALSVTGDIATFPEEPLPSHVVQITRNGRLAIEGPGGAAWSVTAIGDVPPDVRPEGDLTRTIAGEMRQGFVATDDYGVVAGQARFALDLTAVDRRHGLTIAPEPRTDIIVDLPMPFRGDRLVVEETLHDNLAEHAWAGLPVSLNLSVEDAAGQMGSSVPEQIKLPGRRFLNPLAASLIEQRRDLMWSRENGPRVAMILRAVSYRPDGLFPRETQLLKLRMLIRRLEMGTRFGLSEGLRDEVTRALWDMAIEIEDGSLSDALERLRRAEERLSEAMEQGASPEELSELMDELRQAMKDYMDQLAAQQPEGAEGQDQQQSQNGMQITPEDLEAMMDRIEELMQQGRQDEAQAMLDAMREMMENMQVTQGQPGEGNKSPGEQAMEGLQDTLRQQQGLSDEAFRDLQEQANPNARAGESSENVGRDGGQGRGQAHSGEGGEGQGEGEGDGNQGDLADRQSALRDQLREQQEGLPGAGSPEGQDAREALGRAGDAMDSAEQALRDGDVGEALNRQAEAMEAMREGMRQFDNAMAQQQQQQGQQGAAAGEPGQRQSDPLGRDPGSNGTVATDGPLAEGEDVYRRAQELMDELRRRSGDGARPELERDYLKRLLDRF
ncbi:TIGR02302 family protein [Aliiroseovarius subalbicans]|uniref:TIGR02302 family protein n=1 Tax=Aliiroseovarius subalbicans TaxID=2925840 RepID=UPI001F5A5222|nr:TIGR02302 family protein [Aliiroseovarius subalbicans]MCI2399543.1 TIGR02302 family protein [Aliiroseovarius subalbicans]